MSGSNALLLLCHFASNPENSELLASSATRWAKGSRGICKKFRCARTKRKNSQNIFQVPPRNDKVELLSWFTEKSQKLPSFTRTLVNSTSPFCDSSLPLSKRSILNGSKQAVHFLVGALKKVEVSSLHKNIFGHFVILAN